MDIKNFWEKYFLVCKCNLMIFYVYFMIVLKLIYIVDWMIFDNNFFKRFLKLI